MSGNGTPTTDRVRELRKDVWILKPIINTLDLHLSAMLGELRKAPKPEEKITAANAASYLTSSISHLISADRIMDKWLGHYKEQGPPGLYGWELHMAECIKRFEKLKSLLKEIEDAD